MIDAPPMTDADMLVLESYLQMDGHDEFTSVAVATVRRLYARALVLRDERDHAEAILTALNAYRTDKITPVAEALRQIRSGQVYEMRKGKDPKN